MSRLKKRYQEEIKNELQKKFGYKNPMTIPGVRKIVINLGIAEAAKDKNALQDIIKEVGVITGQAPLVTRSKKAISNFKLRAGQPIGLKVTLRGERMYDFMDRFINIVCPRIRDFRGFPSKCDGQGNYSLGLDDHQAFPELNLDEVKNSHGLQITFVTDSKSDEECIELLRLLGMPFKKLPVVVAAA